ncbi:MAG: hypothetical protein OEV15_00300 [Gallionella sp.]|nr:hypothetical protein [Gallionella sp.]
MTLSLLAHALVFFAFDLLLRLDTTIAKQRIAGSLEVRLSQAFPPKAETESGNKLLTSSAPAPIKIARPKVKKTPVRAPKPAAQIVEQSLALESEVGGIAFPSAVATPLPGQPRMGNPFFQLRSAQQNAAQTYQQQAMEAQARMQSAQHAQIVIVQLQQLLAKQLDVQPAVAGKCMLAETGSDTSDLLVCDSPALYEVINKDEKTVAAMLSALREMGSLLRGFSAEIHADRLGITLVEQ